MNMNTPLPPVLDACCGPRMFWFNQTDGRALFVDKRRETCIADTRQGRREIVINPDVLADFKALPFPDNSFSLVVFDPPHTHAGPNSWTRTKYGALLPGWREEMRAGFAECFRVLHPRGTLIFKWNEHRVPVSTVLSLTDETPLFGQRCGTTARTHWIVFMKESSSSISTSPKENRTMDIATLLESHRRYMLEVAKEYVKPDELSNADFAIRVAHDRATTRTLLDMYRSGNVGNGQQPVGQSTAATTAASRRPVAGSKEASQRALKAGKTRKKNLAARATTAAGVVGGNQTADVVPLSPATHLAPCPPEGGAA